MIAVASGTVCVISAPAPIRFPSVIPGSIIVMMLSWSRKEAFACWGAVVSISEREGVGARELRGGMGRTGWAVSAAVLLIKL